jgi:hypothetical protein
MRPSCCPNHPRKIRGRREDRVLSAHPRPVCIGRKHTVVTTGGAGSTGLPCAMVLTAYIALSPGTGLSCPRHFRRYCSLRKLSASVGAPGPHAFAVRFKRRSSCVAKASTASHPAFVTTRTPLLPRRDGANTTTDLGFGKSEIFLQKGLDAKISKLPDRANQLSSNSSSSSTFSCLLRRDASFPPPSDPVTFGSRAA